MSYKKAVKDVSKFHYFYYADQYKGVLKKERNGLSDHLIKENLYKSHDNRLCKTVITECPPSLEVAPKIREMKQLELFIKWRKLIPEIYQDEICPKLTDEIMKRVKKKLIKLNEKRPRQTLRNFSNQQLTNKVTM